MNHRTRDGGGGLRQLTWGKTISDRNAGCPPHALRERWLPGTLDSSASSPPHVLRHRRERLSAPSRAAPLPHVLRGEVGKCSIRHRRGRSVSRVVWLTGMVHPLGEDTVRQASPKQPSQRKLSI